MRSAKKSSGWPKRLVVETLSRDLEPLGCYGCLFLPVVWLWRLLDWIGSLLRKRDG
jgi:hypothetical protein